MPTRARSCTTSIDEAYISSASSVISPSTRALATVSFIRFKERRKVDLPQPDGPMKAVTRSVPTSIDTSLIACLSPSKTSTPSAFILGSALVRSSWVLVILPGLPAFFEVVARLVVPCVHRPRHAEQHDDSRA